MIQQGSKGDGRHRRPRMRCGRSWRDRPVHKDVPFFTPLGHSRCAGRARGGGAFIWCEFFAVPKLPESIVALNGRTEGDDSVIAPKTGGRILEIEFRGGDSVKASDIIAILKTSRSGRAKNKPARRFQLWRPDSPMRNWISSIAYSPTTLRNSARRGPSGRPRPTCPGFSRSGASRARLRHLLRKRVGDSPDGNTLTH